MVIDKLSWFLRNAAAHVNAKFIFVNQCRKYLVGIELWYFESSKFYANVRDFSLYTMYDDTRPGSSTGHCI